MDDRPQDRVEDRRRRSGPLGDEGDTAETTRRVPLSGGGSNGEDVATRRTSPTDTEHETREEPTRRARRTSRGRFGEDDPETRVIRTPGGTGEDEEMGFPESPEVREERLKEIYGGVDWLASFIGCVFAVVCVGALLPLSGLVLGPLGFTLNLQGREIDATIVIGFAILGAILFFACLFGGYVAGRLARFDGGLNGAMAILIGLLLGFVLLVFVPLLPGDLVELLRGFEQNSVQPVIKSLAATGLTGAGIAVGALLLVFLGGFLGGRLGNHYHTRIDYTL